MSTTAHASVEGGSVTRVALPSGHVVLIDTADAPLVDGHHWCANTTKLTTYAQAGGQRRPLVLMHRLILGAPVGVLVDHRNGNGLDNRRANLRLATRSQNGANSGLSRRNTSGYKGVSWRSDLGRWHSSIKIDGRSRHLGYFNSREDAAQAYNAAAVEAWGPFARLNAVPA